MVADEFCLSLTTSEVDNKERTTFCARDMGPHHTHILEDRNAALPLGLLGWKRTHKGSRFLSVPASKDGFV